MIFAVTALIASFILFYVYWVSPKCLPGPWNLPIIGYLHKLDPVSPHLTLTKLAQKYGPIFRVKLGLINIAVVSDAKLLKKILLKDETLERPPFLMLHVMFDCKGLVYSPLRVWKEQRKFTSNFLRIAGATKFSPRKKELEDLITNYAGDFIHHVAAQGNRVTLNPSEALMVYVSNVSGSLILGKSFSRDDKVRRSLMHNLDAIMHSAQLGGTLNFLPFLRFLPKYRKTLATFSDRMQTVRKILRGYINECEKHFSDYDSPSNFIEAFLSQRHKGGPPEIYNIEQHICLLFDMFTGSTETTVSSLMWILLYLAQHQEVQEKVRQELLGLIEDKTFEMSDLSKLPYTQATYTETARIRTIVPLGFPHYTSHDLYVDDIKISKGTTIMPLLWAIHMNPKVYDKPEEFRPERFLSDEKKFTPPDAFFPFQCGKRMCVGDEFARMLIYIFIASFLKNFKVEPCESTPIDFSGVCGLSLTAKPQNIVFVKI